MIDFSRYSYTNILRDALERVPDSFDKREGSIIYDAIAPACYELALAYQNLYNFNEDTFALTATGQYLDLRVQEAGLSRKEASKSLRLGVFEKDDGSPKDIDIGTKFSSIQKDVFILFSVVKQIIKLDGTPIDGSYELQCDEDGNIGNSYIGPIVPIESISGLAKATLTDILKPGQNVESDDDLRNRYFDRMRYKAFGGNERQYKEMLSEIDGVGASQIYAAWEGGGTVLVSLLDPDGTPLSEDFINEIKELLDPEDGTGLGVGMVPIGHRVTVKTPTILKIKVDTAIELESGFELEHVRPEIVKSIERYLKTVRREWETSRNGKLTVYLSKIVEAITSVSEVHSIPNNEIKINGSTLDLILPQNAQEQLIPVLSEVILHE